MIYILNLNPAIDYYLKGNNISLNKTNYAKESSLVLGGKGSNTAIVLNNLKQSSVVLGFIGGFTGDFILSELSKFKYIKTQMTSSQALSRINVKLNFKEESEINSHGEKISNHELELLSENIKKITSKDTVILSGSLPKGVPNDYSLKLAEDLASQKVEFIVDISEPIMLNILKYQPLLIKPNLDEVKKIYNHNRELLFEDLIFYGKDMLDKGAKHVIISMKDKGSLFFFKDQVYQSLNLNKKVISTVGAGDSMVGGFIAEYKASKNSLKAYKLAQACGNATAFSNTLASGEKIYSVLKEIEIKEIQDEN